LLRKQLLPIDQKAYAKDFQERYDNEFLQVKETFRVNEIINEFRFSVGIKVILMVKQLLVVQLVNNSVVQLLVHHSPIV
jgi:hypothetical protein